MSIAEQYDLSQLLEEREWRKCCPETRDPEKLLEAFRYFCENYWYIKHPEHGRIRFDMFQAQVDSVELWINNRYSLMLKARQLGFSTLVSTYAFWLTFFYPDRVVIMLSRTERDAIKLLSKAKYGHRFLPEWMKFRGPPDQHDPDQDRVLQRVVHRIVALDVGPRTWRDRVPGRRRRVGLPAQRGRSVVVDRTDRRRRRAGHRPVHRQR